MNGYSFSIGRAFVYARCGEIATLHLFGVSVYARVRDQKWLLGVVWGCV